MVERYALRRDMLLMERDMSCGRDMSLTGRDMSCGRDILPKGKAICLAARYVLTGVMGYGRIRGLRKFFEIFHSNPLHF